MEQNYVTVTLCMTDVFAKRPCVHLQNAGDEVGIVERVGGGDGGPAMCRRAAATQRLAAVQAARRARPGGDGAAADVARQLDDGVRQRTTPPDRLHQVDDEVVVGQFAHAAERHLRPLAAQRTRKLTCGNA